MIEYSYKIDRDQGNKIETYKPVLPQKLPILCSVEGPNSSGKSTLLHILGICFNGTNSRSVNESLVGKMDSLMDQSYNDLQFDIRIESKNETLRFTKEKGKRNIDRMRLKGEEIEYIDIDREYQLIYDIPINPVERLKELTIEVRIEQESTENKLRAFQKYTKEKYDEAKKAKNPVYLERQKNKLEKLEDNLKKIVEEKELLNSEILDFEMNRCVYLFYKYNSEHLHTSFINKKITKQKKYDNGRKKTEYSNLKKLSNKIRSSLQSNVSKVSELSEELKSIFKGKESAVDYIDINKLFVTGHVDKACVDAIDELKIVLDKNYVSEDNKIAQHNVLTKLVDLIKQAVELNVELSNDDIDFASLQQTLTNQIDKENSSIAFSKKITYMKELLDMIKEDIYYVESEEYRKFLSLKKNINDFMYNDDNCKKDLYVELMAKCEQKAISLGFNVRDQKIKDQYKEKKHILKYREIFDMDEETYQGYIEQKKYELEQCGKKEERMRGHVSGLSREIQEIEDRPESEYTKYITELELAVKQVSELISEFSRYKEYTEKLSERISLNSEDFNNYSRALGKFLAKRLGKIIHVDKEYTLISVDILNNKFITEEEVIIRFEDMGTGQSQSAYLRSKLNSYSGKKIIALFDEIAMMDSTSLNPIYKKISDMYDKNELLTAIVVQKGETIKVKPIEEVV